MSLQDRLRRIVQALPSEASSVTLTRADLVSLLEGEPGPSAQTKGRDLTVEDVAERMGRAASTVRGWLLAGNLRGFKLNGRDWRVPPAALEEFRQAQMDGPESGGHGNGEDVDISAWRRLES